MLRPLRRLGVRARYFNTSTTSISSRHIPHLTATATHTIMALAAVMTLYAALFAVVVCIPVQLEATTRLTWWQYLNWRRHWCLNGGERLVCRFTPTTGSSVEGMAMFSPLWVDDACRVQLYARIRGLKANHSCAIHIHTWGDTTSDDAKSLGGHFASPAKPIAVDGDASTPHGLPTDARRHWGDLGSLKADANGVAVYYTIDAQITLAGIVGRGMVIHRDKDLGAAKQPSGGAGPRKAMCVIGYANPDTVV